MYLHNRQLSTYLMSGSEPIIVIRAGTKCTISFYCSSVFGEVTSAGRTWTHFTVFCTSTTTRLPQKTGNDCWIHKRRIFSMTGFAYRSLYDSLNKHHVPEAPSQAQDDEDPCTQHNSEPTLPRPCSFSQDPSPNVS